MSGATAHTLPTDYDAFAPHYDAFTSGSDYEDWARVVLEHAGRHGLRGRALLDIACGTGNSFLPFLRRGFHVSGSDSSSGMLAEAARKAPRARLVLADMRELPKLGEFDLVTCFDDSLNYLLGDDELAAALAGIASSLAPAGLAVFDLNSLLAYRTTFARDEVTEAGQTVFAWRGAAAADASPGCEVSARLDIFARTEGELYTRVSTTHRQRHFPLGLVVALLEAAGLECVAVHGVLPDCSLAAPADEAVHPKLVYTARHRRGGDAQ